MSRAITVAKSSRSNNASIDQCIGLGAIEHLGVLGPKIHIPGRGAPFVPQVESLGDVLGRFDNFHWDSRRWPRKLSCGAYWCHQCAIDSNWSLIRPHNGKLSICRRFTEQLRAISEDVFDQIHEFVDPVIANRVGLCGK